MKEIGIMEVGGFRAVGMKRAPVADTTTLLAPYTVRTATPGQESSTCGGGRLVPSLSSVR